MWDFFVMAASNEAGEPNGIGELEMRRRRLRYRAWHRGTQEMDLVLGPYADAHAAQLDGPALDRLEGLMNEEDTDLLKWVIGQEAPRAGIDVEMLERLIDFRSRNAAQP